MRKMKSMTAYRKWEIVLVPFPFTNMKSSKKRPALVISPDQYNDQLDVVIAFITSKLDQSNRCGDYIINEWSSSGLPKPSMLRMKFATVDKSMIIKKIGKLSKRDQGSFTNQLVDFFTT